MTSQTKRFNITVIDTTGGGGSSLETVASALSPGQWGTVTTTGLTSAMVEGGGDNILSFARKAVYDNTRHKLVFSGATHGSGSGSYEHRILTYDVATNTWSVEAGPQSGSFNHGYGHLAINEAGNRQFIKRYDPAANTIDARVGNGSWSATANSNTGGNQIATALDWHPGLNGGAGGLVHGNEFGISVSNQAVTSWTNVHSGTVMGSYHNVSCYSPLDNAVFVGGGQGDLRISRISAAGVRTARANTPYALGQSNTEGALVGGIAGKKIMGISSAGVIRKFDDPSNTWEAQFATLPVLGYDNSWAVGGCSEFQCMLYFRLLDPANFSPTLHVLKV